jgi:hypothetical protein
VLGVGGEGTWPSDVILPDGLGLGARGIALHTRLPKGAPSDREPGFPCDDSAFPTVPLLLPDEE